MGILCKELHGGVSTVFATGVRSSNHQATHRWPATIHVDESEPAETLEIARQLAALTDGLVTGVDGIAEIGAFFVTVLPSISAHIEENGYWQWIGPKRQSIVIES